MKKLNQSKEEKFNLKGYVQEPSMITKLVSTGNMSKFVYDPLQGFIFPRTFRRISPTPILKAGHLDQILESNSDQKGFIFSFQQVSATIG